MTDGVCFAHGSLRGRSQLSTAPHSLYSGEYDLAVLVSSWDRRATCVTAAKDFRAAACLVVLFNERDRQGLRDAHDFAILDFARTSSQRVIQVGADSLDLRGTWLKLLHELGESRRRIKRPLRLFIDASVCPRYYLLGLVATSLSSGIASHVSISYAEGRYPRKEKNTAEDISFTYGQWKSVAVPGLEGRYSPGLKRFFLVSIGFEGWKTMRAVTRADPDRVSLLHGKPGTNDDYPERSIRDNAELINHYKIPPEQILNAHAGDAIAAWQVLSERAIERTDENAYFLCSGTKPHSLALGLRALSLKRPAVLYNLPEAHEVVAIESNGKFWRFDVQSVTVPI